MHEKNRLIAIQKVFFFLDGFNIFSFQITFSGILIFIEDKLMDFCLTSKTDKFCKDVLSEKILHFTFISLVDEC